MTLYNSFGQRLSIAKKNNLYNKRENHIDIIPNNTDVYNLQGKYLGTIVKDKHFYYFSNKSIISLSLNARLPSIPIPPTEPNLWSISLPIGEENIDESLLD